MRSCENIAESRELTVLFATAAPRNEVAAKQRMRPMKPDISQSMPGMKMAAAQPAEAVAAVTARST